NGSAASDWVGDIFSGELFIFTQADPSGTTQHHITLSKIPAPHTAALFAIAAIAAPRRRR
ncbi:MAG: hypothetical protein VYC34_04275, partial [Planctomycetota bacterium]|nr:hypothetical protein [Planctomycetota bacterium]